MVFYWGWTMGDKSMIRTVINTDVNAVSLEDLERALNYVKRRKEEMDQRKNILASNWYNKRIQEYEKSIIERVLLGEEK